MLLHQTETKQMPLSSLPRLNTPPAPEELARAVVAIESERQDTEQMQMQANVSAQTLVACGTDITPKQLLAEVQAQRVRMDQEKAMTRQSLRDRPFWLLVGGAAFSTAAALFLLFTSYVFAVRERATNAILDETNTRLNQITAAPNLNALIQEWDYDASPLGISRFGEHLSTATITTTDAYDKVWWYYANKSGYPVTGITLKMPGGVATNMVSGGSMGGSFVKDGQSGSYFVKSDNASPNRTATFIRVTKQGTISANITYDAAHKQTNINMTASAP